MFKKVGRPLDVVANSADCTVPVNVATLPTFALAIVHGNAFVHSVVAAAVDQDGHARRATTTRQTDNFRVFTLLVILVA